MEEICVHTNDKHYTLKEPTDVKLSSVDFGATIQHSTKSDSRALNNQIWDDREKIYWKMETDYPHIEGRKLEEKMVKLALLESSFETPLVIRQRRRGSADAQLIINWFGKKDERYFTSASTLAFAYGPGRGLGGNCTMNSDVAWGIEEEVIPGLEFAERFDTTVSITDDVPRYKVYDALHTLKHELGGHAMGLRHLTDLNLRLKAIMFPYYNGIRKFGIEDLAYLHRLYGKASINHRIKEYLLLRIFRGII